MTASSDDRIHALDVLRGLALLGMIVVHFHQRMRIEMPGLEDLIGWVVYLGLEQKAWGVFALLFGVGLALLARRLEARGRSVAHVFLRRFATLAAFGVAIELAFGFSILFEYACWGIVLLAVRRWPTRALLGVALIAAVARPLGAEFAAWWAFAMHAPLAPPPGAALRAATEAALHHGSYAQVFAERWRQFIGSTPGGWRGLLPDSNLTLFVLGLLAVRLGVVDAPLRHVRLIVRWMAIGAASWAMFWLVSDRLPEVAAPGAQWPIAVGFGLVQDQWLCLTYAGGAWLALARWPAWTRRLAPVGQAGRMAFTNYAVQAGCVDILSAHYGLDVRMRPFVYVPAAILLFAALAAFSTAWLARFRFGPLEWAWRAATFLEIPALRHEPGTAARA